MGRIAEGVYFSEELNKFAAIIPSLSIYPTMSRPVLLTEIRLS
jgi:hypothetical protein